MTRFFSRPGDKAGKGARIRPDASYPSTGRRPGSLLRWRSVAGQVLVLQLALVVLLIAAALVTLVLQARSQSQADARHRSLALAEAFANSPGMATALKSHDPTAVLQPRAEEVRKKSGVDAVVVYNAKGIRYTHPDPGLIGKHIIGPERFVKAQLSGKSQTASFTATQGPSVLSTAPIHDTDGSFLGGVSVAITVQSVNAVVERQLPVLLSSAGAVLALSMGGAALVSRRLRRQTHGLGPAEMTRMYEHHDAVLHAIREGVVIIGGDGRLLLANDEARHLLKLSADAEGRHVTELGLEPGTAELLTSDRLVSDEVHLAADRLLAVSTRPTAPYGGRPGSVATLRDTTELRALVGKAEVARERLTLLYDASVRIGTTLDVTRTAEELTELAAPRFADTVTVDLAEPVLRGDEPVSGELELRRTAVGGEHRDEPVFALGELIRYPGSTPHALALETGKGVLEPDLRNSPRWRAQEPDLLRRFLDHGIHGLVTVPLHARGVALGLVTFYRSEHSEPFEEDDLVVAEELVARAAVCIDNARRYTREHTMAVTLQRSLLPRGLPEQEAVEVAHRYLPAQAGVRGDWFDVIPLPGARVALVVGDVVGHGLHAAATMGRLRTAVHNFSALDLPPDELLAHLDDLVTRTDLAQAAEDEGESVTGATCLYAVYDPVSGHCTLARAGHPGPALVHPDGAVVFPDVPASPPLGLGVLPIETSELELAEGSRLVLYTNGLIESRERDIDTGLDLLRTALSEPAATSPEETCQAVFATMLPVHPSDDIALLVARTRLLDPARVADWEVPLDPAAVAHVRAACTRQLEEWGLDEVGFTTELILSELITNAIRYGAEPIRVRLLHDRALICEVSDGSSTSPHLRRAATTDEGGRGLFLVSRFAQRWGTRHTPRGKVIWAEQSLADEQREAPVPLLDDLSW
ncbi:SpoIIE family protein phosphatase [Streptomyces sp. NPDC001292]|uniref:SpoIIE family protein phosphatase n=1 Tax=Streptomyces sp. NPDC001292 TaxID=3364558 RepID=UPI0036779528